MGGSRRPGPAFWLTLLAASLLVSVAALWEILPAVTTSALFTEQVMLPPRRIDPPSRPESRPIRLVLPAEGGGFAARQVALPRRVMLRDDVEAVLQRWGQESRLAVPGELRHVFLDAFGILYLDFGGLQPWILGLDAARGETVIRALCTTLAASLDGVTRVQFLADGRELEGPNDRLDLRRPIMASLSEAGRHVRPSEPATERR